MALIDEVSKALPFIGAKEFVHADVVVIASPQRADEINSRMIAYYKEMSGNQLQFTKQDKPEALRRVVGADYRLYQLFTPPVKIMVLIDPNS